MSEAAQLMDFAELLRTVSATCDDRGVPYSPLPTPDGPRPRPATLREGLDRVLDRLGSPPVGTLEQVRAHWAELVGPQAAEALEPVSLADGRLVAVTDAQPWLAQARWLEGGLIAAADELLGQGVVTELKVTLRRR